MALDSIRDLYLDQISDLYSAETQIIEALPKMIERANDAKLRDGFTKHLKQTQEHARRLEEIGGRLGESIDGKKCKGMAGLLKEGEEAIKEDGDAAVVDLALIAAAQRVEHYEMAAYGCTRALAESLGESEDVEILQQTLDEEGATDHKLTQVAMTLLGSDVERTLSVHRDFEPARRPERDGNSRI